MPTYSWDFGDGESSTERSPSHTYKMAGEYLWEFIATNDVGVTITTTGTVYVYENSYSGSNRRILTKSGSCFRFAIPQEKAQGIGWSEYRGRDFVWPVGLTGATKVLNEYDEPIVLVTDGRNFNTYQIGRKDWWRDGGNDDYAGAEIDADILFKEHVPPIEASAKIRHSESHANLKPWYKDRRNIGDYGEFGFRDSFRSSMYFREDSSPDDRAVVRYFPRKAQIVSDRHIESESLQGGLRVTGAPWRLPSIQMWFEQIDTAAAPLEKQMSEKTWAEMLENPYVWIGRSIELVNLADGSRTMPWDAATNARTVGSFAGVATGPDGNARSGIVFAAADNMAVTQDIENEDFTMVFWVRSPASGCRLLSDTTAGLRIRLVQIAGAWELRWNDGTNSFEIPISMALTQWTMITLVRRGETIEMYENSAFANTRIITGVPYGGTLTFYSGGVSGFEPRIVPENLTADAVAWLYNDVVQNSGNSTCAMY